MCSVGIKHQVKGTFRKLKDQIILATGQGILADFWVPHEIESCNFQNFLVFEFLETSQNFISYRQLLFSLFQMRDTLKKSKKPESLQELPRPATKMICLRLDRSEILQSKCSITSSQNL